ncbi:calcium-binding protein [Falsiroseomonas sp. CW058]|uniref:calcium-binding protein n=1 Tax=Falsiroseomonas sp. CW058 TaxID=3388664 RepID=UPI003D320C7C
MGTTAAKDTDQAGGGRPAGIARIDDAALHGVTGGMGGQQGGAGADTLTGEGLVGSVSGGGGDDVIGTRSQFSFLNGEDGQDTLRGGTGWDQMDGGAGADLLDGGAREDTLSGGRGDGASDTLLGGDGTDRIMWQPGDGNDVVDGGAGGADMFDVSRGMDFAAFQAAFCHADGPVTLRVDGMGNVQAFDGGGRQVEFRGELTVGGETVRITGIERVLVHVPTDEVRTPWGDAADAEDAAQEQFRRDMWGE